MRRVLPSFAYEENLVTEDDPPKPAVPDNITALPLLQMAYRGQVQLTPQQMRAAIEALPFEVPKLSAAAITTMDEKSFAAALERAIERSRGPVLSNGPVQVIEQAPAKNYRRIVGRSRS
jgi:hypothetical protein